MSLDPDEVRIVNFRMTQAHLDLMDLNAERAGMGRAEFYRSRVLPELAGDVAELEEEVRRLRKLIRELNRQVGRGFLRLG